MCDVTLGNIVQSVWDKSVFDLIDRHIQKMDKLMTTELLRHNGMFTEHYAELLKQRGVNLQGYTQLFNKYSHDKSSTYIIFQFLQIGSEGLRQHFASDYTADLKGYQKFVRDFNLYKDITDTINASAKASMTRLYEHTYINGASGSGKSTVMLNMLHQLVETDNAIVVIDPQGDFSKRVSKLKNISPNRLVYLKPMLSKDVSPVI